MPLGKAVLNSGERQHDGTEKLPNESQEDWIPVKELILTSYSFCLSENSSLSKNRDSSHQ